MKDFVQKSTDITVDGEQDPEKTSDVFLVTEESDAQMDMTINEDVRITEYAPAIFSAIREMDSITDAQIQKSLNTELNRTQVFKAKESAGKSGSFFFFSYDKKFLIKTMNNKELDVFLRAIPTYLFHL